jgi:CHAT domain-containing protein
MEVDSIAGQFQRSTILKNEEVSEQKFKEMLQNNGYRYLHLATHGIIDENHPSRSGLVLSAESELSASSQEDGMLRSSEIFGLSIKCDMVVLSACNTGLGKVVKGEGMLGMQRAFFYAGASTVVVSLWNVYDRSTASFMNEFYKSLNNHTTEKNWTDTFLRWVGWDQSIPFGKKALAMREAKLQMIKHPLFNHPVYWAPFVVVGR